MQTSGLDTQVRALKRYCTHHNITDYIIYKDDGISGAKASRPALNRMMRDVEEGKIDRVVVYSFSRYVRSTRHLLSALETFKSLEVGFVSTTERVVNELRAAKERGVHIGRKKTRPSVLIRRLRSKGLTFRKIAELANCSQCSVALEVKEWNAEKAQSIFRDIDDDICSELSSQPAAKRQLDAEIPPIPIEVIRY